MTEVVLLKIKFQDYLSARVSDKSVIRFKSPTNKIFAYLGDKPRDWACRNFRIPVKAKTGQSAYRVVLQHYRNFLVQEGKLAQDDPIVDPDAHARAKIQKVRKEKEAEKEAPKREEVIGHETPKKSVLMTLHAQYKIAKTKAFLDGVTPVITSDLDNCNTEREFADLVASHEQVAIRKFIQHLYDHSEEFYVGQTTKNKNISRYRYNPKFNAVIVMATDEDKVITVYESWMDKKEAHARAEKVFARMRNARGKYSEQVDSLKKRIEEITPKLNALRLEIESLEEEDSFSKELLEMYENRVKKIVADSKEEVLGIIDKERS